MGDAVRVEGRSEEIERIERFLDTLQLRSTSLILEGEPGIGKTVLWEAALDRARQRGWQCLTCRPGEFEVDLVFAALGDLVSPVAELTDELPIVPRNALRAALMLEPPSDNGVEPRAVGDGLLTLLRRIGESSPVLLAIDDLQWIDPASAKAVQFALRRLDDAPVGMLATLRGPSGRDRRPNWAVERLPIGRLDTLAIEAMLLARAPVPLRRSTVRRICELSGGNPLLALEMARSSGAWQGDQVPVSLATALDQLMQHRLTDLPSDTRTALLLLAVLAEQPAAAWQQALDDMNVRGSTLDAALDAGIVSASSDGLQFSHPLYASVTYWSASAGERRTAHGVAAAVLGATPSGLRHRAMISDQPDRELAAALEQAASDVATRGAPEAAAILLADAVRVTPLDDADERVRRVVECARRQLDGGDPTAASALLRQLMPQLAPGPTRARVLHTLARAVGQVEGFRAAATLLEEALSEVPDDPRLRCAIERDLANAMSNVGRLDEARVYGESAAAHARELSDVELVHAADVELAVTKLFLGLGPPADIEQRARAALERLGTGAHVQSSAHMLEAMTWAAMLRWVDSFDSAREILRRLVAALDHRHEDGLTVPVLFQLGELECWSGDLVRASELASTCSQAAAAAHQQAWTVMGLYLRALVDATRGSVETSRAAAAEAMRIAERHDEARMLIRVLHVAGTIELSGTEPGAAVGPLLRAVTLAEQCGYREPAVFRIDADAVEALVACGRLDEAEARTERLHSAGRRLQRASALAASTRCKALLAYSRGDLEHASLLAVDASAQSATLGLPIEHGRTLLLQGTVERPARRNAAARSTLESALAVFTASGAGAWVARTQAELARIGGRTPSPLALTAAETAVAELVARGHRNREIADELHLSEKTVEANLTRIYRKLGVRSRSELAVRVRDQSEGFPR